MNNRERLNQTEMNLLMSRSRTIEPEIKGMSESFANDQINYQSFINNSIEYKRIIRQRSDQIRRSFFWTIQLNMSKSFVNDLII